MTTTSSSHHADTNGLKAFRGFSLIEIAISMLLFGILSVAIASLLTSGMDAQMSYRTHVYGNNIAMNVIDRMRIDLLAANDVRITGGNTLRIENGLGIPDTIWVFNGTQAVRNGVVMSGSPALQFIVTCGGNGAPSCLQGMDANGNPSSGPDDVRRVILHELTVVNVPGGPGTAIDRNFGPARFRISEFSFEIPTNYRFE